MLNFMMIFSMMIFLTSDSVLKKDKNYYLLVYSSDKEASDAFDKKGSYKEQIKYQMMNINLVLVLPNLKFLFELR